MVRTPRLVSSFLGMIAVIVLPGGAGVSAAEVEGEAALIDTLGQATPDIQFYYGGTSGTPIYAGYFVGPQFTLDRRTLVTEIGGFINNCRFYQPGGIPECPEAQPFIVEIHRSKQGVPHPSSTIASFTLSHDGDPRMISYEFAEPYLTLREGTYFAIFKPQNEIDRGWLMGFASLPFRYLAGSPALGIIDFEFDRSFLTIVPAAVRILGIEGKIIDIRPGGFLNSINPEAGGQISVAILGSAEFDVLDVDVTTIRFGPAEAPPIHDLTDVFVYRMHLGDTDRDGYKDLTTHFDIRATGIACDDRSATLIAETKNGTPLEGSDGINTVGCHAQKRRSNFRTEEQPPIAPRPVGPVDIERD